MSLVAPAADRLPFTAEHYRLGSKPAALIPGRCGVVYDPAPRTVPWTQLIRQGTPISREQFTILLFSLD
jgi:hypothetical protein